MSPADLTVPGVGWLQLVGGGLLLLLPGLAAADRLLPRMPLRLLWAPVFSFSLLSLAAILGSFAFRLRVDATGTAVLAVGFALLFGRRRLVSWARAAIAASPAPRGPRQRRRLPAPTTWALLAVLPFVFVVHSLPHLPGAAVESAWSAPGELASRGADLATGRDTPYPVHVDELYHLAQAAAVLRTGEVEYPEPYTGKLTQLDLFSLGGVRSERGFHISLAQTALLTGASLPTLFHFLPALWATYLALLVWATLRPAPGAAVAAAFTALLPTTVRFLGAGFLVPSAFALPWVLATLAVALRGRGPGRFFALLLLITGAFLAHIVLGTLSLAAGLLAALLQPGRWLDRAALAVSVALPLLWLYPAMHKDALRAVATEHGLPFQPSVFLTMGVPLLVLAVIGAFLAAWRRGGTVTPHRVFLALAVGMATSMALSLRLGHHNEATYSRLIPTFFLTLAGLGSLAVGVGAERIARWRPRLRWPAAAAAGLVAALALLTPVQARLNEPYYRIMDPPSWEAGAAFAASGAGPNHTFLGHPWRAPVYNALTGARPWAYMYPGEPAIHGDDYAFYLQSGGASAGWLGERGIGWVVDGLAPQAPHASFGEGVHRLGPTLPSKDDVK